MANRFGGGTGKTGWLGRLLTRNGTARQGAPDSGAQNQCDSERRLLDADLRVSVAARTDPGCQREQNEDAIAWVIPERDTPQAGKGTIVVIADGMGGELAGEAASEAAVSAITQRYYEEDRPLPEIVREAGNSIFELSQTSANLTGMGTTCVALTIGNGQAFAAHVGDSRLYLIRAGQIYQMTEDHSLVFDMVKAGLLTREQARNHEDRNVISRALGTKKDVEVAVWDLPLPVKAGDQFVLSTDGLHDLVEDAEILSIVGSSMPAEACEQLVELAKMRGGSDNITVAVVMVENRNLPCETRIPERSESGVPV
jgi:PPM family protein phosphatase